MSRSAERRAYRSDLRQAQARSTRKAIVDAATRLFTTKGYGVTSIDDIAREAGVSRATVFAGFRDKATLLKTAYDWALVGDDEPRALREREIAKAVLAERDPQRLVELFVRMAMDIGSRLPPMYEAVRGAATADAAAQPIWEEVRRERSGGARNLVGLLVERGALRPDLTEEEATDIVFALTDPGLYTVLVEERGWSPARMEKWYAATLKAQLLLANLAQ